MYLYILIISLFALWLFALIIFRNDIFHPCAIVCFVFFASAICTSYNADTWDIELGYKTVTLIILSLIFAIVPGVLIQRIKILESDNIYRVIRKDIYKESIIKIDTWKIVFVCIFGIITIFIYFSEVQRIAVIHGFKYGTWNILMRIYRDASHFHSDNVELSVSFIAATFYQLFRVLASLIGYVCANNIAISGRKGVEIKYFLPILIYFFCSLLTGGRMPILRFFFMVLICFSVIKKRINGWDSKINISLLIKIFVITFFVLLIFSQLRTAVGRNNKTDFLSYITMYGGGSIALLDLFIKDPISPSRIWGKETFQYFLKFIGSRFHISDLIYVSAKEFRSHNGVIIGNTYTALRSLYYDFGFYGCLIFCGIFGLVFSALYYSLKEKNTKNKIDMKLMVYSYISYSFFLYSINSYFDFMSFNFLKQLVFFYALRYFLLSFNIKMNLNGSRLHN